MIVHGLEWPGNYSTIPNILAYGDSWFDYPILAAGSLLIAFDDATRGRNLILTRAIGGNEMITDIMSTVGRRDMRWDYEAFHRTIKAILVSGGGNDLTGEDGKHLQKLLRQDCSDAVTAADCFNESAMALRFDELIGAFRKFLSIRDNLAPRVPVFVHTYDYAWPSGKGVLWLGPWIKPALELRQVPQRLCGDVVNILIDRFHVELAKLQQPDALAARFHIVNLTYTLSREDWANELHPTPTGFARLGERFNEQFERALAGP